MSVIRPDTNVRITKIPVGSEPQSVALTPNGGMALLGGGQMHNPADKTKLVDHDIVTLVNLQTPTPMVLGTVKVGKQATGIAVSPNGTLAHALGYVGEVSTEQLKQQPYKDKGFKPGDIIGQEGIEKVYDDYLRGKDGYRKVIVDSRGHGERDDVVLDSGRNPLH